ncbi:response regulator [Neobacillus dielmonensis]|uniref:response regulator n=1 Tax=Neobacillus dielmonensis TaxID=1347369 RepID=UPI0006944622|nr:response regulator [Neobacillus dielmonensis]
MNMKMKTKLVWGLSVLPLVVILLVGVGWYQIASFSKTSNQLQEKYQMVFKTEAVQTDMKDVAIELRNLVIYPQTKSLDKEMSSIQEESETINQKIASLQEYEVTAEQKQLLQELNKTNQTFMAYKDQILLLVSEGKSDEAIELMETNSRQFHDEYFQSITNIIDSFEKGMKTSLDQASEEYRSNLIWGMMISLAVLLLGLVVMIRGLWRAARRLKSVADVMTDVSAGTANLKTRIVITNRDEIGEVAESFNRMTQSLDEQVEKEQRLRKENQEYAWIKANLADILAALSGKYELEAFTSTFLSKVVPLIEACQAVFYLKEYDEQQKPLLNRLSSYAFYESGNRPNYFYFGEGIVGQAAVEKYPILLTNVPSDYLQVQSGLGEASPNTIYVLPISFEGDVKGVVEIASFNRFSHQQQLLLEELVGHVGIMMESIISRARLAELLEESQVMTEELQAQSEELQTQQEELRATNEELESQTVALRESEEKLQAQQEELEETNVTLREKAEIFEMQNKRLAQTNQEMERARRELEEQAKQLALSSKYKSEFLANMSHELRTPLNSLLILSKLLGDNQGQNLTEKQVEFAQTIYSSGSDLLTLINDILDLAKIESGKMDVQPAAVSIEDLMEFAQRSFQQVANEKGLTFHVVRKQGTPTFIYNDSQRIQQVLMNLLSNAFKFTHQGEVTLEIGQGADPYSVYFAVSDTGIGIPESKHDLVFEAFQQADGTTSRKYGGTGLGLSICREISILLSGKITVDSVEGKGSTFTFYLGDYQSVQEEWRLAAEEVAASSAAEEHETQIPVKDPETKEVNQPISTDVAQPIKRLLIVDDDRRQRNSLMELIGNRNVVLKAVATGAEALEELKLGAFDGMILDLGLADTTGFEVLGEIRAHSVNEGIKIFIYTGRELTAKEEVWLKKQAHTIIMKDALAPQRLLEELEFFLRDQGDSQPIMQHSHTVKTSSNRNYLEGKKALIVDDDVRNVFALSNILEGCGMEISFAENGRECLQTLSEHPTDFDLILMDIMMPEMDGYETMKQIRKQPEFESLPIIALTAKAMMDDRAKCIEAGASDYITKPVNPEQLISLIKVWLFADGKTN